MGRSTDLGATDAPGTAGAWGGGNILLPRSHYVRSHAVAIASLALLTFPAGAQARDTTVHDKTFLTRRDLLVSGLGLGATALVTVFDHDIARASQEPRWQDS